MTRIGINGMGRIGRCVLRAAMPRRDIEVVGVNDLAPSDDIAYLIRNDSVHGRYPGRVELGDDGLVVDDTVLPIFSDDSPDALPWADLGADVVIESTGAFRSREDAARHLSAGARTVIISAPSDDADATIVPGVNDDAYDADAHEVVSLASCTTNCVAPVIKVLHDSFGVLSGLFTTVHAYTASQELVDGVARKRRRGRAAAVSNVPTTTGAAKATERVLPELDGRLDGMAIRSPVPDGSITDLVAHVEEQVSVDDVNDALRAAAGADLEGILDVSDDALVSVDIIGDPHSAVVDAPSTRVLLDRHVKVLAWYDNEMGYSSRLVDFAARVGT